MAQYDVGDALVSLTNDTVFKRLAVPAITLAFIFFPVEMLNSLVVEEAVNVATMPDLVLWFRR
jgi:hypothetical protein